MQRAIPIRVQHENTSELFILFFPTFCRARSNASNCTESVINWRIVCDNATVFCLWNFAEKGFLLFLQAKCSFYYISSFIESLTKDTILCWKTHRCAWPNFFNIEHLFRTNDEPNNNRHTYKLYRLLSYALAVENKSIGRHKILLKNCVYNSNYTVVCSTKNHTKSLDVQSEETTTNVINNMDKC